MQNVRQTARSNDLQKNAKNTDKRHIFSVLNQNPDISFVFILILTFLFIGHHLFFRVYGR